MNATELRERCLLDSDLHFYTREAWCDRGEQYGRTADLTLTLDGAALYDVVNFTMPELGPVQDAFVEFLGSLGYWYELGYAWSLHMYPLHPVGAGQ